MALTIDCDAHLLTHFELASGRQSATVKGHVEDANGYFGIVGTVNQGVDIHADTLRSGDPFSFVPHDSNSVGPQSRS